MNQSATEQGKNGRAPGQAHHQSWDGKRNHDHSAYGHKSSGIGLKIPNSLISGSCLEIILVIQLGQSLGPFKQPPHCENSHHTGGQSGEANHRKAATKGEAGGTRKPKRATLEQNGQQAQANNNERHLEGKAIKLDQLIDVV